jgi:triosephosphate isomerase (TIM)
MPRKPLVVGNWKMHGTLDFAAALARGAAESARKHPAVDVGVAPPFTALAAVREVLRGSPVALAAQNVHDQPQGAFTGEISTAMLADVGCTMALVGHSERRHVFGEPDDLVGRKVKAALANDLIPLLCVGEKLDEREAGKTLDVARRQLETGTAGLDAAALRRVVVAYEPVWAIGTGKVAKPEDAQQVHAFLRRLLEERSAGLGAAVRILYGGSVKPDNAAGLFTQPDIDGFLVGGASLKAADFEGIVAAGDGRRP